ncbi:hypothetical protein ARTHRO9AX_30075 [Arthrobacter sp. 9AX]|nr:hypothetical protein ARTHRO9AX_30075 [Arthrobacter sp. 9AX]
MGGGAEIISRNGIATLLFEMRGMSDHYLDGCALGDSLPRLRQEAFYSASRVAAGQRVDKVADRLNLGGKSPGTLASLCRPADQ